ncbi:helix-turn-helix domain-containing protein [Pantoea dispersa]|uniref:helix-turn-helix transcriptional regulator n=1 Tax=Pantoea dispersa TaxID=59814 RepID=UPI003527347C
MVKNTELSQFLRSRRARVKPERPPSAGPERRRTPGLRREEVAAMLGISTEWYTKIEQGRVSTLSERIVNALCKALQLNEAEFLHLKTLTGRKKSADIEQEVPASLSHLVRALNEPAYVTNDRWDVLVWNSAAEQVITDFSLLAANERNIMVFMFTTEAARYLFGDTWPAEAQRMLGLFHSSYSRNADNETFTALVERLSRECPEFDTWWSEHVITAPVSGEKKLTGKDGITRTFSYSTFTSNDSPALKLAIYVPLLSASGSKVI